jgi:hypothetical protein
MIGQDEVKCSGHVGISGCEYEDRLFFNANVSDIKKERNGMKKCKAQRNNNRSTTRALTTPIQSNHYSSSHSHLTSS